MIHRTSILSWTILALFAVSGCAGPAPQQQPSEDHAAAAPSTGDPQTEEVLYEPAYPEEVDSEGLTESDTAQQKTHSHDGGEAHSHGEGEHSHGPDGHGQEEPHDGHSH